ncbi:MAG TPA: capsid cement protein [Gemmataceae bacterium]|nr:capsid cement protein [Gemmataceae bacterium]
MAAYTGPSAIFRKGKPVMIDFDAGGNSYRAGDVVVIGPTPCVAHEDIPAFTGGPTRDALAVRGGVYEMATDGTGVIGDEVFWDAANKKITATAAGNTHFGTLVAGPSFLLSGAGPAADLDLCWVLHGPKGKPPNVLEGARSEATQNATATLTPAQVQGGLINSAPAAAITLTTPPAATLVAGIPGCKVGDAFDVTLTNTAGAANSITLAAGAGATLRGGTTVAQNKSALLRFVLTNVTPGTEAYVVHSIVSA